MAEHPLLPPDAFAAVTATVRDANPGMDPGLAERIVADALAFVATCAASPRLRIAPTPLVDEGWHALILHTALYADLCRRLGGFVHHYPERPEETSYDPGVITRTVEAMQGAGWTADRPLWAGPGDQLATVGARAWHTPPGGCGPIETRPKPPPPPPPTPPNPSRGFA